MDNKIMRVFAPRDACVSPLFSAQEQNAPLLVKISDSVSYLIGYKDNKLWKSCEEKAFDIRHAKLIFILLFLTEKERFFHPENSNTINVSVYKLCKLYYQNSKIGSSQYSEMLSLLGDLRSIAVKYVNNDKELIFTVIHYDTQAKIAKIQAKQKSYILKKFPVLSSFY
ncbi:MAG: hypothetical protein SNJ71_01300 [Bacteroidales bacterium]